MCLFKQLQDSGHEDRIRQRKRSSRKCLKSRGVEKSKGQQSRDLEPTLYVMMSYPTIKSKRSGMWCRHDQDCRAGTTGPDAVDAGCRLARELQFSVSSALGIKRALTPVSMAIK